MNGDTDRTTVVRWQRSIAREEDNSRLAAFISGAVMLGALITLPIWVPLIGLISLARDSDSLTECKT